MIITSEDPKFQTLENAWKHEGGDQFMCFAALWRRVEDNDQIKYVRITDQNAFGFYASESGRNLT